METLNLGAELRQEQKLTPQLLLSTELLQMNSLELTEYVSKILEENPVLEQEDHTSLQKEYEELRQKASWIDGGGYWGSPRGEKDIKEPGRLDYETESLSAFLRDQLERKRLSKPLLALSVYLVELLDEDGFLTDEDLDGLQELKIPQMLIQEALNVIQSLEPAGVGARNLSECLLLQLRRSQEDSSVAQEIVSRFLPELAKKHYVPIAQELGVTIETIRAAEALIETLNPHPGMDFISTEQIMYIRPDIFVAEIDGEWKIVLNETYLPRIYISDYYTRMLQESDEKETRDYLRDKMQQAKWLLYGLSQRGQTLRRCAETIFEMQKNFFLGRSLELAPMGLSDLAEALRLHPSTISRATRGKYLQCKQGTYPLRYFFNRSVSEGTSRQAVKQKLLHIFKDENPAQPFSDQKLCDLLAKDGITVSRRVVTKYRLELGIASSTVRKKS